MRLPTGLRARLAIWYLLLCTVVLAGFGAVLYAKEQRALLQDTDAQLALRARVLMRQAWSLALAAQPLAAGMPGPPGGGVAPAGPGRHAPPVAVGGADQTGLYIYLADRQGRLQLWWSNPAAPTGDTPNPAPPGTALPAQRGFRTAGDWRVLTIVQRDGRGRPIVVLEALQNLQGMQGQLRQLLTWLLVGLPLVLALATAGGLFLVGRALAPIDQLIRGAQAIGAGNLSGRLGPAPRADEVGRLAMTLDAMLDRLEHTFAQQRAFTAAASHELRTPLTILKGDLDVLRQQRRTPAEYEAALGGLDEEVGRLCRLVDGLLTLAQADGGQVTLQRCLVPLDQLAGAAAAAMVPLAQERDITMETHLQPDLLAIGDPLRLRQLVLNLLDNAVRYTPAGGSIRVGLAGREGWASLSVADTGMGIAAADLPRIFDRFFRADRARSRAAGGTGLGLAIARWCAEEHGGRIEVVSEPGQGSTFTVRLPLAPLDEDEPAGRT